MLPPLILLERTPRWAAAFRREMRKADQPFVLQEVRSLPECQRELEASPHSVIAVEVLSHNLAAVEKALSDWNRRFPHARFIALAARGLEAHELLLREAGALHVTFSPRSLSPLLRLIRRHLARAPQPELTLKESIEAGLPWG
ncbi:MAG: hypothetical protein ACR2FY_21545 [Pirellulaceae bacterium]